MFLLDLSLIILDLYCRSWSWFQSRKDVCSISTISCRLGPSHIGSKCRTHNMISASGNVKWMFIYAYSEYQHKYEFAGSNPAMAKLSVPAWSGLVILCSATAQTFKPPDWPCGFKLKERHTSSVGPRHRQTFWFKFSNSKMSNVKEIQILNNFLFETAAMFTISNPPS